LPDVVRDTAAPTPQSSYGTQKVIGELLVSDYTRKGFIDGRCVRLSTMVLRAEKRSPIARRSRSRRARNGRVFLVWPTRAGRYAARCHHEASRRDREGACRPGSHRALPGKRPATGSNTPDQFAETIREDTARWAKVVRAANIRAE
jgi:nucleoside-diphosphate-sugar epimerase